MLRRFRVNTFGQLLLMLVLVTLAQPFLSQHRLLEILSLLVLLDGIYIAIPKDVGVPFRRAINAFWIFAAVFVVAGYLTGGVIRDSMYISGRVFQTTLYAVCLTATLLHVLREKRVTLDLIFAAMAGYFFIVSTFAGIYQIATVIDPTALHYPAWAAAHSEAALRSQLSYFSFVTAASLGYGDIVPRNPYVQMFAAVEVVLGQFYLATIIARLVSIYKSEPAAE